jgi:hypothetical protein
MWRVISIPRNAEQSTAGSQEGAKSLLESDDHNAEGYRVFLRSAWKRAQVAMMIFVVKLVWVWLQVFPFECVLNRGRIMTLGFLIRLKWAGWKFYGQVFVPTAFSFSCVELS